MQHERDDGESEGAFHVGQAEQEGAEGRYGEGTCGRTCAARRKAEALGIRFEQLIRDGVVADYADLARLGHITRARMTQIMNLLHLAPDIQEGILFLPAVEMGKDPVTERELRKAVVHADWRKQRRQAGVFNCLPVNAAYDESRFSE